MLHTLSWLTFSIDDVVERVSFLDLTLNKRQDQVFVTVREDKAIERIGVPLDVFDAAHVEAP